MICAKSMSAAKGFVDCLSVRIQPVRRELRTILQAAVQKREVVQ